MHVARFGDMLKQVAFNTSTVWTGLYACRPLDANRHLPFERRAKTNHKVDLVNITFTNGASLPAGNKLHIL